MIDALSPEIDACRYLYLRRLWEPEDNQLCIIVDEAVVDYGDAPDPETSTGAIVVGPQSRAFQLSWPTCVAYSVRNESFAVSRETDRVASGRLLVRYEASDYLDYLRKATFYAGMEDLMGAMIHVQIVCLNHIIDVVSGVLPELQPVPSLPWDEA